MRGRARGTSIALIVTVGTALLPPAAAVARAREAEAIEFEDLEPGCVVDRVGTTRGNGPVWVRGVSPVTRHEGKNVAVVLDTLHRPSPDPDPDLRSPHQRNALIVSDRPPKDLRVDPVNDLRTARGLLRFDFSDLGPITFYGLTLIDSDDGRLRLRLFRKGSSHSDAGSGEAGHTGDEHFGIDLVGGRDSGIPRPRVRLYRSPFVELEVERSGEDGSLQHIHVGDLVATDASSSGADWYKQGIENVERIEVEMGGSGAIDSILFELPNESRTDPARYLKRRVAECSQTAEAGFLDESLQQFDRDMAKLVKRASAGQQDTMPAEQADQLFAEALTLLVKTERRVMEKLETPKIRCRCPESRALRRWAEKRFDDLARELSQARAGLETARFGPRPVAVVAGLGAVAQEGAGEKMEEVGRKWVVEKLAWVRIQTAGALDPIRVFLGRDSDFSYTVSGTVLDWILTLTRADGQVLRLRCGGLSCH